LSTLYGSGLSGLGISACSNAPGLVFREQTEELKIHGQQLEELVKVRTSELEEKVAELERMNDLFVGREFRVKELRDRVEELEESKEKLGN